MQTSAVTAPPSWTRRIILEFAVSVMALLFVGTAASAQQQWQPVVLPNTGTTIEYPADLFGPRIDIEGGAMWSGAGAGAGATLELTAATVPGVQTIDALWSSILAAPGYEAVTYSPRGDSWLVVSGYRGTIIFYEKFFVRSGTLHAFSITFPASSKPLFAPVVERMEDSFRIGDPLTPVG